MTSKLELIEGSCVNQKVDVVVNAANRNLLAGGGVCGAIFFACGYDALTKACKQYKTPLKDGQAVFTPSFDLKTAKGIIHAVGPDFSYTPNAFDKLFDAYYNSLILLQEHNLHTIAFPLISSGIFGGNLSKPAYVSYSYAKKAFDAFVSKYTEYEIEMKVCAFSSYELKEIKKG